MVEAKSKICIIRDVLCRSLQVEKGEKYYNSAKENGIPVSCNSSFCPRFECFCSIGAVIFLDYIA